MSIVDRACRAALLALCLLADGLPAADAAKEARLAANVLFNQGLYQQAGAAYSAFLATHPRHAEAAAVHAALPEQESDGRSMRISESVEQAFFVPSLSCGLLRHGMSGCRTHRRPSYSVSAIGFRALPHIA